MFRKVTGILIIVITTLSFPFGAKCIEKGWSWNEAINHIPEYFIAWGVALVFVGVIFIGIKLALDE